MIVCGTQGAPSEVLRILTGLTSCCWQATEDGPGGCGCWVPEYDLGQQATVEDPKPGERATSCVDCAYRANSPERTGDDRYSHGDVLDDLVVSGRPFFCHVGIRKPVRWRHPLGIVIEADVDGYQPPIVLVDGRQLPIKADGTGADLCHGWAAARRQLETAAADVLTEVAP